MIKRNRGRLPKALTAEQFSRLIDKPSTELVATRSDLGSLMALYGAMANRCRVEAEAISSVLYSRERPNLEASDHAVIRWLEKVKGIDIDSVRQEITAAAVAAKEAGEGSICRAKGDAVAYSKDNVTFVVAHRNVIVTIVTGDYLNPTEAR